MNISVDIVASKWISLADGLSNTSTKGTYAKVSNMIKEKFLLIRIKYRSAIVEICEKKTLYVEYIFA